MEVLSVWVFVLSLVFVKAVVPYCGWRERERDAAEDEGVRLLNVPVASRSVMILNFALSFGQYICLFPVECNKYHAITCLYYYIDKYILFFPPFIVLNLM